MKKINPEVKQLISELKLAEIMYRKTSLRVVDQPVKDQLASLADRKVNFMMGLMKQYDVDIETLMCEVSDMIRPEWEKLEIELDHLLLQGWEKDILDNCILREKKLIEIYKELSQDTGYDDFMTAMFASQLSETYDFLNELEDTKEVFVSIFSL
ncbi:hypothetical protein N7E81_18840 [Reichenbachiella carrageenanivorans]|uniref:Ferritin-like metal-binding protein YciE n=1 Tax=Reichenbachiella carrageenanivorans TaxID=2979869 RepID=A0ABY6D2U2_9BACT|nr:hypothetical protein [Reichenbachiella carrageenanivorans]UXX79413.1 hypothetical protein N7E81_18840 [Reichenbachiella carrageenanivorans]